MQVEICKVEICKKESLKKDEKADWRERLKATVTFQPNLTV